MKIDREHYETYEWKGSKEFHFQEVNCNGGNVGSYTDKYGYFTIFFEMDTLEEIGMIYESENRTNFKSYYSSYCTYGWDGDKKTKKEFWTTLCTRGFYGNALQLLLDEYKRRKA